MIGFQTLAQRHLIFAYCAVWILQFGYGTWLFLEWRKSQLWKKATEPEETDPVVPRSHA